MLVVILRLCFVSHCGQVLQRVRRETGVFWYTGLDKVMHRAVNSMFDYYERNGGKATFKSILGERKKSDHTDHPESPAQYMRRQLAVIFPRNFEREMNAVIALDSVQQTEYKVSSGCARSLAVVVVLVVGQAMGEVGLDGICCCMVAAQTRARR